LAAGINDAEEFINVTNSLKVLGLNQYYDSIFQIVAAIMLLGNFEFDSKTLKDGS
jgi:myosin heavy subunit